MDHNHKALPMWNGWSRSRRGIPVYDPWLGSYLDELKLFKNESLLELGCGCGADTHYLCERGYHVLAADYSEESLKNVRKCIKNAETILLDMNDFFPFEDESFHVIIADMSLHYFDHKTTVQIMNEIKRILKPGGFLLARVSSTNDVYYGAGSGKEIEKHYYDHGIYAQRYFDEKDLRECFGMIGNVTYHETSMTRDEAYYSYPKYLYEIKTEKG